MFSGIQELLLLAAIVLLILFLPRLISRWDRRQPGPLALRRTPQPLSGRLRLAIVASLFWLLGTAVYFKPWKGNLESFLILGLGLLVSVWGLAWAIAGFKKGPRRRF
jgi:hypothetical protein